MAAEQLTLIPQYPPSIGTATLNVSSLPPDGALAGPSPDAPFIESIRRFGIIQPITVRNIKGTSTYAVIDGRRRLKAARVLGLEEIPAVIVHTDGLTVPTLAIASNAQRGDNPASDLAAITELATAGASEADIAEATGLPIQAIRKRLKLNRLLPTLRAALMEGRIRPSIAERCTYLSQADQERMAATLAEHGRLKMRDVLDARRVQAREAVAALPADLFDVPDLGGEIGTPTIGTPGETERDAVLAKVAALMAEYQAWGVVPGGDELADLYEAWSAYEAAREIGTRVLAR